MKQSFPHISELQESEFDLSVYKKQYERCKQAIETGNWEGYSESLKGRKETLILLKEIVDLLENKIQRLNEKDFKNNRN
jgi:hypothetical protein